jgi:DNA-directed RNA polymerase beta' subunit
MFERTQHNGSIHYSKVSNISFYVRGSEEILKDSVVHVTNREIMKNNKPVLEGIYDPRMGTTDIEWDCHTCFASKGICPGHFGSMDLRYPVKSPLYREELLKWLKILCYNCGTLLVDVKLAGPPDARLSAAVKSVKNIKECHACKVPHKQVTRDMSIPYVFLRSSDAEKHGKVSEFYNHDIKRVLEHVTPELLEKFGIPERSHPKNFIITTLAVPPNPIRPDIHKIGTTRCSNSDTTTMLKTISEINERLPEVIPNDISEIIRASMHNLDLAYNAMIRGGSTGESRMVSSASKPPVSLAERFPKKLGRVRRNLMGKRVSYMIRSVITGDPKLKINEIGIPLDHAKNLEIPETVTSANVERLKKYYYNSTKVYPGCKNVAIGGLGIHKREKINPNYTLQIGDIVYRDMITGDCICFNRQPSLTFASIAGMRVVIMETGSTLKMNPMICNYFNADFDGDQMHAIVPQSIMSRNECMTISKASRWFISPQVHAPLIGSFQDALIGIAEFTKADITFDKWHAMQMFANIETALNYEFTDLKYTNRQLVTRLLPKINIFNQTPSYFKEQFVNFIEYNPADIKINIVRGEHRSGILDKATLGQNVPGTIIHTVANEYGNDRALDLAYNLQQMTDIFLLYHGFTIGIADIVVSQEAIREVKRKIAAMILKSRQITNRLDNGKLIAPLGVTLKDFYESEQLAALTPGDDFINSIMADIPDINTASMVRMILTGSKGKLDHYININAAIGTQSINNKRFPEHSGTGRCLPYFTRYDADPAASGFVAMSYREGIQSAVYAFACAEGREAAITNAMKTAIAGYQSRISVKNLETIIVNNLRSSTKSTALVQILYAECGINASKLEKVKFPTVGISDADFAKYNMSAAFPKYKKELLEEFTALQADRNEFRRIHIMLEAHNPREYILSTSKQMPVNVSRVVDDVIYNYAEMNVEAFDPEYTVSRVSALCDGLGYVFLNENCRALKIEIPKYIRSSTRLMQILIRSYLNTHVLSEKKMSPRLLDICIERILLVYKKSLIDYGTSAGIIAAQCVSSYFTQYMLDAKHRSGGGGGTKTNSIERTLEIIGAKPTSSMKNTHMLIMVKPEYENDKNKVQEIANSIEMNTFERFVLSEMIFFESYGKPTHPDFITENNQEFEKYNRGLTVPGDLAKWCIRYELNREEMIIKSAKLETIVMAIRRDHPELFVAHTAENSPKIIIRVYLRNSMFKQTANYLEDNVKFTQMRLKNVIVRGVAGIIGTSVVQVLMNHITETGAMETKKVNAIYTDGTNLAAIIMNPHIDPYRTQSDSIEEVEKIFGITAARNKIIHEMVTAMNVLNRMHCNMFADEMCFGGNVSNIQKTGLQKREKSNVTLRLSFQTAIQVIQQAAIYGLVDHISGVSGPLVMGTNPNIGTTYNAILINQKFLNTVAASVNSITDDL